MLSTYTLTQRRLQECVGCVDGYHKFKVNNAAAYALLTLMDAGEQGVTSADLNVLDPSNAIHRLRTAGLVIETKHTNVPAGGSRFDRRYVLRSKVSLTAVTLAMEYSHAA